MSWTAPLTWTTSQLVTAANLNQQIRDNEIWLKEHDDLTTASATHALHGFAAGSSVSLIGSKLAAGLRLEYKTTSVVTDGSGKVTGAAVAWTNAFTVAVAAYGCVITTDLAGAAMTGSPFMTAVTITNFKVGIVSGTATSNYDFQVWAIGGG